MEKYLFIGTVYPERAQISFKYLVLFDHLTSGKPLNAEVSVLLNQVSVWVECEEEWDIFDLRNVVQGIIQDRFAILGYLLGRVYDVEVTRVLNRDRGIDQVFGIDIPCISNRLPEAQFNANLETANSKVNGIEGVFLGRCFKDLVMAMRNPDDTAFYCYRAIESLRHHCAASFALLDEDRPEQWKKFREVSGVTKADIMRVGDLAKVIRHGGMAPITSQEREVLFGLTWDIVDAYLRKV